MTRVLVDHDIEGQATLIWGMLAAQGWLELTPLELVTFSDVGLPFDSTDREVWSFAQAHEMVLLTNNRNMENESSLERTLREENTVKSLSVLTVGNVRRLTDRSYRERCALRLLEVGRATRPRRPGASHSGSATYVGAIRGIVEGRLRPCQLVDRKSTVG